MYLSTGFICLYFVTYSLSSVERNDQTQYKGRYSREISNFVVVIPKKVTHTGDFITHLIPHEYKRSYYAGKTESDLGQEDMIHYTIPIDGEDLHVELWPNYGVISPGMVVETRRAGNQVDIRKAKDVQCHYHGRVRGHELARSALSTCYGLTGSLRTKRGYYIIEPVSDHDHYSGAEHPHILYKKEDTDDKKRNCGTIGNAAHELAARAVTEAAKKPKPTGGSGQKCGKIGNATGSAVNVETLVVIDKSMIAYHRNVDVETYALTVMNMACSLYHDATLGLRVNIVIVRIIRLDEEENEMNLNLSPDADKTLTYFCGWQHRMNPGDDTHPNHHDVAVLLTRINICDEGGSNCGLLGVSKLGGACNPKMQCTLNEDSGLKLGYVVAHELAHSLGVEHDAEKGSACDGKMKDLATTVMNPSITIRVDGWSTCSQAFLTAFMETGYGSCLYDEPADHDFVMSNMLPGAMYGVDYQCKAMMVPAAVACEMGSTCDSLNCEVPGYGCIQTHTPPAQGTACGEMRWCINDHCLEIGERPEAVDGGWTEWGPWCECSRTCGSGVTSTERECTAPRPSHGGRYCVGERKKHKICSTEPCKIGQPSFRDVQCSEFNEWTYPEDGKVHEWKGFYMHDENPCVLFCKNDDGQIASLKPKVIDGTTCRRGIRDVCIGGVCKAIPCDLDLESNAVEDVCGICHGDGRECTVKEGKQSFQENSKGLMKLIDVPQGARNIRVEETEPTKALIVVRGTEEKEPYIKGNELGMYHVPGSKAWLGMIRFKQEALDIPGPISKPLIVFVRPAENVTLRYSMGLPRSAKRLATAASYSWDSVDWSKCSANCGPGTEMSVQRCVEKEAGLVEDKFCKEMEKPAVISRPCYVSPCLPRWMVGDWDKDCSECNNMPNCVRNRTVNCVKPVGEGEGETDIIEDIDCASAKPKVEEMCPVKENTTNCTRTRRSDDEVGYYNSKPHPLLHVIDLNEAEGDEEKSHESNSNDGLLESNADEDETDNFLFPSESGKSNQGTSDEGEDSNSHNDLDDEKKDLETVSDSVDTGEDNMYQIDTGQSMSDGNSRVSDDIDERRLKSDADEGETDDSLFSSEFKNSDEESSDENENSNLNNNSNDENTFLDGVCESENTNEDNISQFDRQPMANGDMKVSRDESEFVDEDNSDELITKCEDEQKLDLVSEVIREGKSAPSLSNDGNYDEEEIEEDEEEVEMDELQEDEEEVEMNEPQVIANQDTPSLMLERNNVEDNGGEESRDNDVKSGKTCLTEESGESGGMEGDSKQEEDSNRWVDGVAVNLVDEYPESCDKVSFDEHPVDLLDIEMDTEEDNNENGRFAGGRNSDPDKNLNDLGKMITADNPNLDMMEVPLHAAINSLRPLDSSSSTRILSDSKAGVSKKCKRSFDENTQSRNSNYPIENPKEDFVKTGENAMTGPTGDEENLLSLDTDENEVDYETRLDEQKLPNTDESHESQEVLALAPNFVSESDNLKTEPVVEPEQDIQYQQLIKVEYHREPETMQQLIDGKETDQFESKNHLISYDSTQKMNAVPQDNSALSRDAGYTTHNQEKVLGLESKHSDSSEFEYQPDEVESSIGLNGDSMCVGGNIYHETDTNEEPIAVSDHSQKHSRNSEDVLPTKKSDNAKRIVSLNEMTPSEIHALFIEQNDLTTSNEAQDISENGDTHLLRGEEYDKLGASNGASVYGRQSIGKREEMNAMDVDEEKMSEMEREIRMHQALQHNDEFGSNYNFGALNKAGVLGSRSVRRQKEMNVMDVDDQKMSEMEPEIRQPQDSEQSDESEKIWEMTPKKLEALNEAFLLEPQSVEKQKGMDVVDLNEQKMSEMEQEIRLRQALQDDEFAHIYQSRASNEASILGPRSIGRQRDIDSIGNNEQKMSEMEREIRLRQDLQRYDESPHNYNLVALNKDSVFGHRTHGRREETNGMNSDEQNWSQVKSETRSRQPSLQKNEIYFSNMVNLHHQPSVKVSYENSDSIGFGDDLETHGIKQDKSIDQQSERDLILIEKLPFRIQPNILVSHGVQPDSYNPYVETKGNALRDNSAQGSSDFQARIKKESPSNSLSLNRNYLSEGNISPSRVKSEDSESENVRKSSSYVGSQEQDLIKDLHALEDVLSAPEPVAPSLVNLINSENERDDTNPYMTNDLNHIRYMGNENIDLSSGKFSDESTFNNPHHDEMELHPLITGSMSERDVIDPSSQYVYQRHAPSGLSIPTKQETEATEYDTSEMKYAPRTDREGRYPSFGNHQIRDQREDFDSGQNSYSDEKNMRAHTPTRRQWYEADESVPFRLRRFWERNPTLEEINQFSSGALNPQLIRDIQLADTEMPNESIEQRLLKRSRIDQDVYYEPSRGYRRSDYGDSNDPRYYDNRLDTTNHGRTVMEMKRQCNQVPAKPVQQGPKKLQRGRTEVDKENDTLLDFKIEQDNEDVGNATNSSTSYSVTGINALKTLGKIQATGVSSQKQKPTKSEK